MDTAARIGNYVDRHYRFFLVMTAMIFVGSLATYGFHAFLIMIEKRRIAAELAVSLDTRTNRVLEYVKKSFEASKLIAKNKKIQEAFGRLANPTEEYRHELTLFLEEVATEESTKSTLLLNADGYVLFSDFAPKYVGQNVQEDGLANSALGLSIMRVRMGLSPDIANFLYDDVLERPALFVTIPVFDGVTLLGIFVQEISSDKIYAIMDDYIGLGRTGDILFGIEVKEGLVVINKSRIEDTRPFKKFIPIKDIRGHLTFPFMLGIRGYRGHGEKRDYMGIDVIAAWRYVPLMEWGASARITSQEVVARFDLWITIAHLLFLVACCMSLLCCVCISQLRRNIQRLLTLLWRPKNFNRFLVIICCAVLVFTVVYAYRFFRLGNKALTALKSDTRQQTRATAAVIERLLKQSEGIGLSIAYDLTHGYLGKDELLLRMERELKEYPSVQGITIAYEPYMYDQNKRLYAPFIKRKGRTRDFELLYHEKVYDYTAPGATFLGSSWQWYSAALKQGKVWFEPTYVEQKTGLLTAGYSVPFYTDAQKTKIAGVVNVLIALSSIEDVVDDLEFGKNGYAYLLSAKGVFLYYPLTRYVTSANTIYEKARSEGNSALLNIMHAVYNGKEGFSNYEDVVSKANKWLYSVHIPLVGWVLNSIFFDDDANLPMPEKRRYIINLWLLGILLIVFAIFYGGGPSLWNKESSAAVLTLMAIVCLFGLFVIIWMTPIIRAPSTTIVSDQVRANNFLADRDLAAKRIHETTWKKIPIGLSITSISFPSGTTLALTGYIWEKFPLDVDREFIQPLFIMEAVKKVEFTKMYEAVNEGELVVGWQFYAVLSQYFDYPQYPFDRVMIRIGLEHPDYSSDILLVPSFRDFHSMNPKDLPGIDPNLKLSGYNIEQSYFAFQMSWDLVTYGLKSYENLPEDVFLTFNIELTRSLLFDFIVFLLPMFIVFFSLFAILEIIEQEHEEGLKVIAAYTGLIFVVTLLHRSLREQHATNDILYIEYLFFMTYVTFVLLLIYSFLRSNYDFIVRSFRLFKIFFWPVQLTVLLIITLKVFYT
jgi:hypothetical protein